MPASFCRIDTDCIESSVGQFRIEIDVDTFDREGKFPGLAITFTSALVAPASA
jgi:hypothetical protein